jgi:uncharacterized protein (TIGR01244 family)
MDVRPITPEFAVSPQVRPEDLSEARRLGFRSIVVARPDDEEAGQPSIAEMRDAAAEAGLGFAAVPVRPGHVTDEDVESFAAAVETIEGPVLGYCRTGARAATLWALNAADTIETDVVLSSAAAAGHDLGTLRARLAQRRADASKVEPQANARSEMPITGMRPCDTA